MAYGFERDLMAGGDSPGEAIKNTVGAWLWAASQVERARGFAVDLLIDLALRAALERMGVEVDPEEPVNVETIGRAIGGMIERETGVAVGNVLNAVEVREALRVAAVREVSQRLGLPEVSSADALAVVLQREARSFVEGGLQGGDAEILDAVSVSGWQADLMRRALPRVRPLKEGAAAESNRRRQERWRQLNRRVVIK